MNPEKVTTLRQGLKLLSQLDGVPSHLTQAAIESGFIARAVQSGQLGEMAKRLETERVKGLWLVIGQLTDGYKDVAVNIPRCRTESREHSDNMLHQVRCWSGLRDPSYRGHLGNPPGHVDTGWAEHLLFQTWREHMPERPDCPCCYPKGLELLGMRLVGARWEKETIIVNQRGAEVDIFRIVDNEKWQPSWV